MATPLPGTPPATPAFNTTATTPPFPPVPPSPPQLPLVNGTAPIPANGVPTVEPPPRGNNSTLVALGVGVGLGGLIVLIGVGVFVLFYKRRKRKRENLPLSSKHEYSAGPPQHMQNNAPPPPHNTIYQQPKPTGTVPNAHSPQRPASTSPVESGSLGSDNIPLPRHPGTHLSFPNSTFTYEELAMATDNFSSANLLGQGGFGYVHRGVLPNGKEVAIKQLKTGSVQGEREFQAEVDTISRVHHRHLVSLVGYSISGDRRMLVYEFISNKTLEFHLHGEGRPPMNWATRLKIALGAAKGLAYLHEDCHPKVIHRDIKAANILLDNDFEAKVADFGLAKFSPDTDTHVSTRVMGTFGYLAPEYAASGKLTEKSDVFSFGVVLLELITGRRPIDKARPFMDDGMVEWARPLLLRAIESRNFDGLVDPRLDDYEPTEMAQMVACAAVSVRNSARRRPQMSQIVRALEGNLSIDELCKEIPPGHSSMYGSSDYDSSNQYKEELNKFRKLALESQEQSTSEYSAFTTDQGAHPSTSSTENQHDTQEIDTENLIKNGVGARVIPVE